MRSLLGAFVFAVAAFAGCAPGEGAVYVTVGANGVVRGVDHLLVTVTNQGVTSSPITIALSDAPGDIPPARSFQLRFSKDRKGAIVVSVDAVSPTGATLAHAQATGDVEPSQESTLLVTLPGQSTLDGGIDASTAIDMTLADAAPAASDLTMLPPPVLTSVSPTLGATTGGIQLQLKGNDFDPRATVTVDTVLSPQITWLSKFAIVATLPAKPGALGPVPVTVTNPDGQSSTLNKVFSYYPGTIGFVPGQTATVGGQPQWLATADFNQDGNPDLVTANANSNNISVLLGDGNGGFLSNKTYATGLSPLGIDVGLIDADIYPDVVTSNSGGAGGVSVLIGSMDGSFHQLSSYMITGGVTGNVRLRDLNNDGHLDIAVNGGSNGFVRLLGDGSGLFSSQADYGTGSSTTDLTIGDLNSDGFMDIVVADPMGLGVLLGTATGYANETFITAPNQAVVAADLNGDGQLDLASTTGMGIGGVSQSNVLAVMLGRGNGTFRPAVVSMLPGGAGTSINVGDLNVDGNLDLTVAEGNGVWAAVGNGDGTFQQPIRFPATMAGCALFVDLNRDGRPDVAATDTWANTVFIEINNSK